MPWSAINLPRGCARVVVHCTSIVIDDAIWSLMVFDPTNSAYCPDMNTIENGLLKINHEKKSISKDSFKKHTAYKQLHVYQTYSYNISSNSRPQLLHKALQSYTEEPLNKASANK